MINKARWDLGVEQATRDELRPRHRRRTARCCRACCGSARCRCACSHSARCSARCPRAEGDRRLRGGSRRGIAFRSFLHMSIHMSASVHMPVRMHVHMLRPVSMYASVHMPMHMPAAGFEVLPGVDCPALPGFKDLLHTPGNPQHRL